MITYLGAVYGPLSAIAHTTGQLQGAVAGARRVRAMLALTPETVDAPDAHRRRPTIKRRGPRSKTSASPIPNGTRCCTTSASTASARADDRARRPDRRRQDDAGQPDSALLRCHRRAACSIDGVDVAAVPDPIAARDASPSCRRTRCSSRARSPTTCATAGSTPPTQEIEEAARAAHAHEFVSRLPKGYDTPIAEAGGGLSGGERQRLSVARAILKNAPILILDEPTSSLDAISEEIVFAALRRLRAGRTTIVIAHRLSTVRDADRILVLDGGRIVGAGPPRRAAASRASSTGACARGCRSASRSTNRKPSTS